MSLKIHEYTQSVSEMHTLWFKKYNFYPNLQYEFGIAHKNYVKAHL